MPQRRFLPRALRRLNSRPVDLSFLFVLAFFFIFCTVISVEILLVDKRPIGGSDDDGKTYFRRRGISEDRHGDRMGFFGRKREEEKDGKVMDNEFPELGNCLETGLCPWQPVKGTKAKFYVFSAYADLRKKNMVRVIGVTKTKYPEKVTCQLGFEGNSTVEWHSVPANIKVIRENWSLKYSAVFIQCPISDIIPVYVSISANGSKPILENATVSYVNATDLLNGNLLPVLNRGELSVEPKTFSVCVKPLHFDWNYAINLIEFIEVHKILGVTHFTFYNNSVGPQVDCLLRKYIEAGTVTLLPWKLNIKSQKEIRTEGLFASLNDCVYRNMYKTEYLLLVDFDEFIIPHMDDTYPEMLDFLHSKSKSEKIAAYSFQNGFFYQQFPRDASVDLTIELLTQVKTQRRKKLHPHKQRSKYICKPEFIQEAGNHFIWEFEGGRGTIQVPPDVGYLHHYRVCEFGGDDCVKEESVVDRTAHKYQAELVRNVQEVLDLYGEECQVSRK